MERGLYAAATGMMAQQRLQETLAQNLANAGTVAYKQDVPTFRAFQGALLSRLNNGAGGGPEIGELGQGVHHDGDVTDWQSGAITQTNRALDASLGTNQFFVVRTDRGDRLTRAGNFLLNGAGELTTPAGHKVLGRDNRPVTAPGATGARLDATGSLTANGRPVAALQIVQAAPDTLRKDGDALFASLGPNAPRPVAANQVQLRPGTLEQSNMNPVSGLVQLISVSRVFEMAHRALTTQDELLRRAATEVGKV